MDLGDDAERPLSATDGTEQCFANQVPLALRVRLQHEVAKQPFDEIQFLDKAEGERPWKVSNSIPGQERKVFHPKLVRATKLQMSRWRTSRADQPRPRLMPSSTSSWVLRELQTGALWPSPPRSCAILTSILLDAQTQLDDSKAEQAPPGGGDDPA